MLQKILRPLSRESNQTEMPSVRHHQISASRHEICVTEDVGMDHLRQGPACSGSGW